VVPQVQAVAARVLVLVAQQVQAVQQAQAVRVVRVAVASLPTADEFR
jgi:hypothetical protein